MIYKQTSDFLPNKRKWIKFIRQVYKRIKASVPLPSVNSQINYITFSPPILLKWSFIKNSVNLSIVFVKINESLNSANSQIDCLKVLI